MASRSTAVRGEGALLSRSLPAAAGLSRPRLPPTASPAPIKINKHRRMPARRPDSRRKTRGQAHRPGKVVFKTQHTFFISPRLQNFINVPKVGAIWLFSSKTANSVYRFIRYQHNGSGRFSQPFYYLLSALMR